MNTKINPTSSFVNGLSHFKNPAAVLPTLIIESCCTAGRTHQSYKRGGKLEAKERFREEAVSGIFWLWGVKGLNKIGDIIGEKVFNIKGITDTGKDALRDPGYAMTNSAKFFKFGKIITSVILATGLLGFVVPKINHAITAHTMDREEKDKNSRENKQPCISEFFSEIKNKDTGKYSNLAAPVAFCGNENLTNFIMKASYNLENNNTWRLISTDTGMIIGRVSNSRHPAEALEYAFRDTSSIYFYNFATPTAIFVLNKLFKTSDIHPKTITETHNHLIKTIADTGLTGRELEKKISSALSDSRFEKIKFDPDKTIKLNNLLGQLEKLGFDRTGDICKKAELMSELQPPLRGEKILSFEQVQDVFSNSITSEPVFLKKVINEATYGRAGDSKKFVSAKTCQNIRESVDKYILEITRKHADDIIDTKLLNAACKKVMFRTAAFQAAGMIFSIFGLAVLIPRAQIFLSQKIFGKKSFEDIARGENSGSNTKSV